MADAPRRRWLTWALVASLGLNLAFAGLVAGTLLKGPPPPPMLGVGQYARALPEPYRRDLGQALRASRGDWIGPRDALRAQRAGMTAALTADPFDPDAVAKVLAGEMEILGDLSTRGRAMLLAEITRMSPADRAAYAEALTADRGRRGREGGNGGPGRDR